MDKLDFIKMFNEQTYRYPTFMNINFLIPKSIYKNYIEIIVFNAKLIIITFA